MGSGVKLGAIALGAGALVVGYLLWQREKPKTDPAHTVAPSDAPAATAVRDTTAAPPPSGSARPRELPPAPVDAPLSGSAKSELALGFDDAHDQLRTLVAPCFASKHPPKGKPITFRYRLLVAEKHATVESPEIVSADFDLGAARDCLLQALDEASWTTTLPDLDTPIEDQLNPEEL